jgi:hypothetical protein
MDKQLPLAMAKLGLSYSPQNATSFVIESCLVHILLTFFVNYAQKFKWLAKECCTQSWPVGI